MARLKQHTLPVDSPRFGGGARMKRKTPSELRSEQLKRKNITETVDESAALLCDSLKGVNVFKKPDIPKNPKYVDTRLGDVYQVKKSRLQFLSGKENVKKQENLPVEKSLYVKNLPILSNVDANVQPAIRSEKSFMSSEADQNDPVQIFSAVSKPNEYTFRGVAELALGRERLSGQTVVEMDKALRELVSSKPPASSSVFSISSKWCGNPIKSMNFYPELIVPGHNTPLDLTLKTYMRFVSSSPISWFHRSIMGSTYNGMTHFFQKKGDSPDQINLMSESSSHSQIFKSKALYSWVYPQSSLPPSIISAVTSSAAEGVEMDFLRKRYSAWENAFRCLYYMLRKNACNLFYVCTAQFVVMFTSSLGQGKAKISCNAYISKSTRGLRSLLKENDVCFVMPLCPSRMEEASTEDLVELSEIENQNIGQTRRLSSSSDVDGTPKSLLAFSGNQNVHGLYDFVLNYRSFLTSLIGVDVPTLYSPVMFQNASLHIPEIQCKELKNLDRATSTLNGSNMKNGNIQELSSAAARHSIEVKDTYIPPWITCNIFAIMSSEGRDFEASFATEPTSAGLNFALEALAKKSEEGKLEDKQNESPTFGIANAFVAPEMCSKVLKGLKFCNNTISASLSLA